MSIKIAISFLFYSIISGITPGPANLFSLSSSIRYGKSKALNQWKGLFIGYLIVSILSAFICYFISISVGKYTKYLSFIGAAYILYLAFKIIFSKKEISSKENDLCSFRKGIFIQVTNVKVIIFCITVMSTYVLPYSKSFIALFVMGMILPFIGPFCNLAWIFAGEYIRKIFSNYQKQINIIMSVSLVICAFTMIL